MKQLRLSADPFQEGYAVVEERETHVFTDFRWNTGVVWRDWKVDPKTVDLECVTTRPFSLDVQQDDSQ